MDDGINCLLFNVAYMYDSTMEEEDAESQDDRESHIGKNCNNASHERFTTQQFRCGHGTVKYRISHTALKELLDILSPANFDLRKDPRTILQYQISTLPLFK